ncbi:MAG: hypothetical protein PF638_06255 [Candidatus Delongbacteria bacterium]|jgi:hypothetical protein|nr:hypothetical protein [Candidatus Delongbacteria bacterium]
MFNRTITLMLFVIMFIVPASTFAQNIEVSGISNPPAANGVYVPITDLYGYDAWKHESQNFWIYNDDYAGRYWNIDDNTLDNDDVLFYNYSSDSSPIGLTGWVALGTGTTGSPSGTPNLQAQAAATAPSITINSATAGGNVTDDGGASITTRGVCWNTAMNPTTTNPHTTESGTTGSFTSTITGLNPGILYHYRSYATNSVGISYGTDLTFTTVPSNPIAIAITIDNTTTEVTVAWDAVTGATSYKVYSSTDPYTGFGENTTGSFNGTSWTGPFDGNKLFYYVVAVN